VISNVFSRLTNAFKSQGVQTIAMLASDALRTFQPTAAGLLDAVVASVFQAEQALPGTGKGAEKKALVMSQMATTLPAMVRLVEGLTGRELVDEDKLAKNVGMLIDAVVGLANAFSVLQPAPINPTDLIKEK
jgi:hypothetical protein